MIKYLSNKSLIVLIIILFFILGQVFGNIAIVKIFLHYKIKDLEPEALQIGYAYANGIPIEKRQNLILQFYDYKDGSLVENNFIDSRNIDLDHVVEIYATKLKEQKTVSLIKRVKGLSTISVIVGVPIVKDSEIVGAVFLLTPADEFETTLKGFVMVYSITILLGTLLFVLYFYIYLKQSKALEQTRKNYIANVSHELKSPIASIKALTETLSDDLIQDIETQKKYFGIILRESNQLDRLVHDMLELSKIQCRKMDFNKKRVSAKELFNQTIQKYDVLCDEMGIEFSVRYPIEKLPMLVTNVERIQQLMVILLDNAVKFVNDAGKIEIDFEVKAKHIIVIVKDNGIGIRKDELSHIFERFYKGNKEYNFKGSGLGLSIAKEIVEGLNERVWVDSEGENGTTFCFTISFFKLS